MKPSLCDATPSDTEATSPERSSSVFDKLTPREREVAEWLSVGATNHEIAERLQISVKTVDSHRVRIKEKVKVRNNVELARLALREGLVTL